MSVLSKGTTFSTGDQVTATNLNNHVDNATFAAGAVDNSTTQLSGGAIIVKDGGITSAKLASSLAITGTWSTTATGATFTSIGASTSARYMDQSNTSGQCRFGVESSVGGSVFTGTSAYAAVFGNAQNYPVEFAVNNAKVGSWSSTGLAVTGTLSASGNYTQNVSNNTESSLNLNQVSNIQWSLRNIATTGAFYISSGGSDWLTIAKTTGETVFNGAVTMNAGLSVTGLTTTDTLRINTAPSSSVGTASTHKVAVNLNGSTYYLLCTT